MSASADEIAEKLAGAAQIWHESLQNIELDECVHKLTPMLRFRKQNPTDDFVIYQHDAATVFRFVLVGRLAGADVEELEHAWTTASSVMQGKELVVDLSLVTGFDQAGVDLLTRMQAAGARIVSPAELQERTASLPWLASSPRQAGAW